MLDKFSNMDSAVGILAYSLSHKLKEAIVAVVTGFSMLDAKQKVVTLGFSAIGAAISYIGFSKLFENLSKTGKIIAGLITILGSATLAWVAYHTASSFGVAAPIIATAIGAGIAGVKTFIDGISAYKTGGFIEDGVFTMNKKEMAGTFDDGTTVVANNMQIQQGIAEASYRGISRAMKETGYGGQGDVYLYGDKVGRLVAKSSHKEMQRTGLIKVSK